VLLAIVGLFAFRLIYGLSMPFWSEDERQVYLIGLQAFARGEWPYFGADVVWTGGRVPGALLGLMVRWPLEVWAAPEAPFVLLNVLSFAALALFAWYLSRRYPGVPRWLLWSTPFLLPWTLNFSTHVVNPSYVLIGGVVFFIGFFEALPALRWGIVPLAIAWAMMGAGLVWTMQLHLSWVLLPPYILAAAVGLVAGRRRDGGEVSGFRLRDLPQAAAGLLIGAAITGSLLAPTIARHGLGAGQVESAVQPQPQSPFGVIVTAARVLSFASFETNRFLGQSSTERALTLSRRPWLMPFVLIVAIAGILHPLWMAVSAFRPARDGPADWTAVRLLLGATILLIYGSYFFSVRGAQAHSFYVVFPVALLFACACWEARVRAAGGRMPRLERVAAAALVASVVMHAGLAADRWTRQSLYVDRALVAGAIEQRMDRWLGERRGVALVPPARPAGLGPDAGRAFDEAFLTASAMDDLQVIATTWTPVLDRFSGFTLSVAHTGRAAAWLDIRFATAYMAADGRLLAAREGVIKQILQPGQLRTWTDIADDLVPPGAVTATITIIGAEKAIPARPPNRTGAQASILSIHTY
jgi:hypothetical protein